MRFSRKQLFIVVPALIVVLAYQNCTKGLSTLSSSVQGNGQLSSSVPVADWKPPQLTFNFASNDSVDLKTLLPAGAKPNGVFSVDPLGAPLPAGMIITTGGQLQVATAGNSETDIDVSGVIFNYEEPN